MNLDDLEKLADAMMTNQSSFSKSYEVMNAFGAACSPQAIKQLIALCRMQHEVIEMASVPIFAPDKHKREEALAAFDKFNGGE